MEEHDDWLDLPLRPEVKRLVDATRRAHLDERQLMLRFAPVLCTCTPWYNWRNPQAPQLDCMVHTTIMFDGDGEWA